MQRTLILLFISCSISYSWAQNVQLSGFVQEAQSREKLIGANVYIKETQIGVTSNNFGFYSLSLPANEKIKLRFSFIGYKSKDTVLTLNKNTRLDVYLNPQNINLGEITVKAKGSDMNESCMNKSEIPMVEIARLPSLTGDVDILKTYQLLPGISMGNEANNGLYVRGGNIDQNLVLLDDVPLYSLGHVAGFVSIFDENAINSMKIIKGAFPAHYGGRLSSIVDIRMKDGDMKRLKGNLSLGLIASKFSLQGPIIKEKASFFVSFRKSMTDLYLLAATQKTSSGKMKSSYAFYDLNAKIHYKLSPKDNLYFSFYTGKDAFFYKSDTKQELKDSLRVIHYKGTVSNDWGNNLIAIRWNHIINAKLFSNITLAHTQYYYNINSNSSSTNLNTGIILQSIKNTYESGIKDYIVKLNVEFYANNHHHLLFGGGTTLHQFALGKTHLRFQVDSSAFPDSIFTKYGLPHNIDSTWYAGSINSWETNAYFEDQIHTAIGLNFNLGTYFTLYSYNRTTHYSLEPRIAVNYHLSDNTLAKVSFSQMTQYIHMISSVGSGLPTNLWLPVTEQMPAEKSLQTDFGIKQSIPATSLEIELGSFYKRQNNLVDFKVGESFGTGNLSWKGKMATHGIANIFGIEFLLRKKTGRASGWLAYTLSKNTRSFSDINNGASFPFTFDRRHDISLVFMYKLKPNIQFSATWIYASGSWMSLGSAKYPLILPDGQYYDRGGSQYPMGTNAFHTDYVDAYVYGAKNNYQLPAYHRLDIALNFKKEKKYGTRTWSLGVYNLYNRQNAYYVYYDHQNRTGKLKLYQFSLIPIFPSFSYKFSFY